jgi:hypothetical protein
MFNILTKIDGQYRLLECRHCYSGEWRNANTAEEALTWAKWNQFKLGPKYTVVEVSTVRSNGDYTVYIHLMKMTNGKYAVYIEMNWGDPDNAPEKTFVGPVLDDPNEAWVRGVEQSKEHGIVYI